jgi:hypothetical protein
MEVQIFDQILIEANEFASNFGSAEVRLVLEIVFVSGFSSSVNRRKQSFISIQ